MNSLIDAVEAVRNGELVVIPTDTVYGLACAPDDERAVRALSKLKRRPAGQPISLVVASLDKLLECVPRLGRRERALVDALLPGPYTLVVRNHARRYPWLTGDESATIGVRVPAVGGGTKEFLEEVGAVAATSANVHGGPDPRTLEDVPSAILEAVSAVLDGGELPGTPSTVLDLAGPEPRVLREGAVPAAEALARVAAVLAE